MIDLLLNSFLISNGWFVFMFLLKAGDRTWENFKILGITWNVITITFLGWFWFFEPRPETMKNIVHLEIRKLFTTLYNFYI